MQLLSLVNSFNQIGLLTDVLIDTDKEHIIAISRQQSKNILKQWPYVATFFPGIDYSILLSSVKPSFSSVFNLRCCCLPLNTRLASKKNGAKSEIITQKGSRFGLIVS